MCQVRVSAAWNCDPLWLWLQQGCVLPPGCSAPLAVGHLGLAEKPPRLYAFVVYSVQPLPKGDQVLNFSDAEDLIDDSKLK